MDEELVTGEAVAIEARPTSFALRCAGGAIDVIAYGLATVGAVWLFGRLTALDDSSARVGAVVIAAAGLVGLPTLVETVSRGRSPGRWATGSRIVRDDGGAISVRHAFIRALLGVFELFATLGGLATVVALLSSRTKRLGDMAAGTYSRHERVPMPRPLELTIPPSLALWAETADTARMPDPLARRIAYFLRQSAGMNPDSRARLAAGLVAETAGYVHPMPPAGSRTDEILVAIAVLRRGREAVALRRQAELIARLEPVLGNPHGFPDRDWAGAEHQVDAGPQYR